MFLVRSKNINESINKDLVRAALTCKHLEVVIIKDGEDDNSSMIKEFLDECEMKDYNISIVNNAPQKETTAYLVYEACPTANVIFGEKGRVYGLMITKHNLIAWNHPSMDEVNRKIDTVLSKSSSDSTD